MRHTRKDKGMYNYLEGFVDEEIRFCSRCGSPIHERKDDGTGVCDHCGLRFGVIAIDSEKMEESKNGEECFE